MEEYDHREEYKIELGLALVSHEDCPSVSHDHKLHILFPPHPLLKEEQRTKRSTILDEGDEASHDSYTRKKLRLTQEQTTLLEDTFREHNTLTTYQKQVLAKKLDLKPRQVEVWFQNKRARNKLKQTEVDFQLLKKWSETLNAENRRLKRELQGMKLMKQQAEGSGSALYLDLPKVTSATTKLTRCFSCGKSRMASMKRI